MNNYGFTMELDPNFHFGSGGTCCGKPLGCNLPYRGCRYIALRKGNPAARDAWDREQLERSLAIPDHWADIRPRLVALARSHGEQVGCCPIDGEFPVGSAL